MMEILFKHKEQLQMDAIIVKFILAGIALEEAVIKKMNVMRFVEMVLISKNMDAMMEILIMVMDVIINVE